MRLTLTQKDVDTIAFVGNRYEWSKTLLRLEAGDHDLAEFEVWEIQQAIEADGVVLPLLNPRSDLYRKILWIYAVG